MDEFDLNSIVELLKELMLSELMEDKRKVIESNPILMTLEVEDIQDHYIDLYAGNERLCRMIRFNKWLLRHCRLYGTNVIFDYMDPLFMASTQADIEDVIRQKPELLTDEMLKQIDSAIADANTNVDPEFARKLQEHYASLLYVRDQANVASRSEIFDSDTVEQRCTIDSHEINDLEELLSTNPGAAPEIIEKCDGIVSKRFSDLDSESKVRILRIQATAYSELATGDHGLNSCRAIACYEIARRLCPFKTKAVTYGLIAVCLGDTYSQLTIGNRVANLKLAIECYEDALRAYAKARYPDQYSIVMDKLGKVQLELEDKIV